MYLTFRPAKGSTFPPKLVKCLGVIIDALLLLLMAWTIANVCYPFWGWVMYASIWMGFVSNGIFFWLIKRFSIRSLMVAKFRPDGQLVSDGLHNWRHFGFLFSVWEKPNSLALGYYHKHDEVHCRQRQFVFLGHKREYSKLLGWLIVLSTDAIPFVLLAALCSAGYFLGIGTIVFFLMGYALTLQICAICIRFGGSWLWEDNMFLDGKMCTRSFLGLMTCVLEGAEGELFLTVHNVVMFDHYVKRSWIVPPLHLPDLFYSTFMNYAERTQTTVLNHK